MGQKGNIVFIAVLAIVLSMALGAIFFIPKTAKNGVKNTPEPNSTALKQTPGVSPSQTQSPPITFEHSWETRTIYPLNLKLDVPSNWSLSEQKDEKNCISYFATSNDDSALLVFSPCEVSENKSSNWPKDTVVIKNLKGGQYLIRFFDSGKDAYIYTYGTKDFLGKSQNGVFQLSRSDRLKLIVQLNINPEVSEKDKYLQSSDKIISSIQKN